MGDWQKWKAWFAERRHSHDSEEIAVRAMDACDTIQSLTAKLERARGALEQTIRLARNYAQKPTGSIFEEAMLDAEQALKDIEND